MTEDAPLPKPGEVIDGKYRIDHRIGSGAMSVVYQVTHRVTQKRFALKWLLPELAAQPEIAQRFLREAQVAGRFEHPNVVEVYDVGGANGFYMVLELLSGESLHQRIQRFGELTWPDTCRLLLPCMRAIAEAHSHGIVHRDIKPANIFVCAPTKTARECTKVLDFGLAKLARIPGEPMSIGTRSGAVMGTPQYMPLEQMRGETIDRRVDVYAFGVTLYQAVSGRLPYHAATFGDLVLAMASEAPVPLERWARGLPDGVTAVVTKALARHPQDRYPDFNAFIDAIAPFVPAGVDVEPSRDAGAAIPAFASIAAPKTRVPPQLGEAIQPEPRRRRWLLGVVVAVGVLASLSVAHHGSRRYTGSRAASAQMESARQAPSPTEPPAEIAPIEVRVEDPALVEAPRTPPRDDPQPRDDSQLRDDSQVQNPPRPRDDSQLQNDSPPSPPQADPPPQHVGRQWRQARELVSRAPPPAPAAEELPARDSTQAPRSLRPRRLPPLHEDEF
jgi:serine/threonine protein kinase